jgi:hypothetical protein
MVFQNMSRRMDMCIGSLWQYDIIIVCIVSITHSANALQIMRFQSNQLTKVVI